MRPSGEGASLARDWSCSCGRLAMGGKRVMTECQLYDLCHLSGSVPCPAPPAGSIFTASTCFCPSWACAEARPRRHHQLP